MKISFLIVLALVASAPFYSRAQSVLHCLSDGRYLPVAELSRSTPLCFTGDDLVRGAAADLTMLPADGFGSGFVQVTIRKHERQGVVRKDGVLMFANANDWYLMVADVESDRDISNCFYAIAFDTYGEQSYHCRPIGDLKAGEKKTIRVYMKLQYEMPKQIHLFSGMEEIRTSLVPRPYAYRNGHLAFTSQ